MSNDPIQSDDDDVEEGEGWLATFADISMLLLVFFILLFSLSTIEQSKFLATVGSIKGALGGEKSSLAQDKPVGTQGAQHQDVKMRKELIEAQTQTFNEIKSFLVKNGMEGQVSAVLDEGTITLRLPAKVLFAQGSSELSAESEQVLNILKDIFVQRREQTVDIRGYTDDSVITPNSRFKDAWELSALRAVNVLRYLLSKGVDAERMTATGLGALNPLFPNNNEANRAKNRRVEFSLKRDVSKNE